MIKLPTIETPTYTLTIPSNKQSIKFRPFLIKEEKILLIAQESEDNSQMMTAIKTIIDNCTFNKLKLNDLTPYDIEYIFLQLRAKSVGEIVELNIKCESCDVPNPISINVENIEVYQPKQISNNIKLTNEIGVICKHLSSQDIEKLSSISDNANTSEILTVTLAASIESIYDAENVYEVKDTTYEEIEAFINSLNRSQMEKIEEFIATTPKLQHVVKFTCNNCKEKNKITLEGLASFFE